MDLAIGVAVGSSMQIALLVLPLMIIIGWIAGKPAMNLSFDGFQVYVFHYPKSTHTKFDQRNTLRLHPASELPHSRWKIPLAGRSAAHDALPYYCRSCILLPQHRRPQPTSRKSTSQ